MRDPKGPVVKVNKSVFPSQPGLRSRVQLIFFTVEAMEKSSPFQFPEGLRFGGVDNVESRGEMSSHTFSLQRAKQVRVLSAPGDGILFEKGANSPRVDGQAASQKIAGLMFLSTDENPEVAEVVVGFGGVGSLFLTEIAAAPDCDIGS